MATVRMTMEEINNTPISDEEIKMLKEADNREPFTDDDSPSYSLEDMKRLKTVAEQKRNSKVEQNVTLQLSPQAIKTAEALGTDYKSILSTILEKVLSDKESIKNFL